MDTRNEIGYPDVEMQHHHLPIPTRGFSAATSTATLRAGLGLLATEVDIAAGEGVGMTRMIEKGQACGCASVRVLRFLSKATERRRRPARRT